MLHTRLLMILTVTAPTILGAGSVSISINQPVTVHSSSMMPSGTIQPLLKRVRTTPNNAQLFARLMIAPLLAGVASVSWYHRSMVEWLRDPSRWCNWKRSARIAALNEMPFSSVIQELLHDMNQRYQDAEGSPLTHLILDIDAEERILQRYRMYISCYRWMRLTLGVPRALAQVDEALERLAYIQSLIHQSYLMATSHITHHA